MICYPSCRWLSWQTPFRTRKPHVFFSVIATAPSAVEPRTRWATTVLVNELRLTDFPHFRNDFVGVLEHLHRDEIARQGPAVDDQPFHAFLDARGIFDVDAEFLAAESPFHAEPGQAAGMQGSIRRPHIRAAGPRMYCVAAKYDQAADPLSQGIREAPARGLYLLCVNWQ